MKSSPFQLLPIAALLSLALGAVHAQETPPAPAEGAASAARPAGPGGAAAADAAEPKAYDKVITKEARSQKGLVKVHQVKTKLYFEIPKSLLGKQLLMVANVTSVPSDVDHVGKSLNQEVVRFFQKGNKVYFQAVDHAFALDSARPNAEAVQNSQRDAILAGFNVEAFAADGSPVIEVSRLFQAEVGEFTARRMVKGTGLDASRSYVDTTRAFPGSIRVDAVHTYNAPAMLIGPMGPQPAPAGWPARSATFNIAYNLVELPEKAMMPRLMDDRVGYFYVGRTDYGHDRHTVERERLITRWRLEKKDPNAAVSEPIKPIVWYIDKSTPTNMVSYVKKGIEAWNVAFEAAGFKNAVQARPFPSKEEDPEFDPEDVRYSIIRWVPSSIPNAYGPHLSDPRSGEILNANIVMYHNIQKILRDWYISQAGAVDTRAQQLPLPDDLMGDLVGMVVTHEVGHSLGFQHNMKASSQYPFEKLRDAKWLKEMGHVSSIMDYSRMNYVVQPEDKIAPGLLIPKIGPYDIFATKWGYAPIPSAKTPEAEKPTLDAWARVQDDTPWLRFQSLQNGDYGTVMEAVGDADAVSATALGTKNLQRIVKNLPRMAIRAGETDRELSDLYKAVWGQWTRELGHVAALVGGYDHRVKNGSQPGAISTPASKAQQARAVAFLNEQLLAGYPQWILEPKVLERLPSGVGTGLVVSAQRGLLTTLLSSDRLSRLYTQEQALGDKAYRTDQLLADLRGAVLTELKSGAAPTGQRRNLQRSYVDVLTAKLGEGSSYDDSRASVRAEVKSLNKQFTEKARAAGDSTTKSHWEELADQTARALDPLSTARQQQPRPRMGLHQHDEEALGCWHQDEVQLPALR